MRVLSIAPSFAATAALPACHFRMSRYAATAIAAAIAMLAA